jgi:uncharacterized protein
MFKKWLVLTTICFALIVPVTSAMDRINFDNAYVYDGANILRYTEKKLLNLYLKDLHEKTTAGVGLVTLPTLKGQRVEDRAMYINKAFQIGGYGKENGVVILASPEENKIAIDVGYSIEDAIPDVRKKQIISEIIQPEFERKFYTKGLYEGTIICIMDVANFYNKKINGLEYKEIPPVPKTFIQKITPLNWALAFLFFLTGIIYYYATRKPEFKCYLGFGGDFRDFDEW